MKESQSKETLVETKVKFMSDEFEYEQRMKEKGQI
jgi:hypothetical protein